MSHIKKIAIAEILLIATIFVVQCMGSFKYSYIASSGEGLNGSIPVQKVEYNPPLGASIVSEVNNKTFDSVEAGSYKLTFSEKIPFFVEAFTNLRIVILSILGIATILIVVELIRAKRS